METHTGEGTNRASAGLFAKNSPWRQAYGKRIENSGRSLSGIGRSSSGNDERYSNVGNDISDARDDVTATSAKFGRPVRIGGPLETWR